MSELALSYASLSEKRLQELTEQLQHKDTLEIIKWAYETFEDDLVYACSFGAEGMVLIDLIYKVRPHAKVIFLDTHLHFLETYKLIEQVKKLYPKLNIQLIEPELTLSDQARQYGENLWQINPDLCCRLRKIDPLNRVLQGSRAWMSGLRREQSVTRAHVQYVNQDHKFQSIKICPLIHWTWDDVWTYIRTFDLPYNELHDKGYPSIGCEKCTKRVAEGEDSRAGRWSGFGKTECGLHGS